MKKKLFVFVLLSFFITLINLDAQIRGAETWNVVVNFGLNQPLGVILIFFLASGKVCCQFFMKDLRGGKWII